MVVEKKPGFLLNTRFADVCLVDVQQVERERDRERERERERERAFISVFLVTVIEH